MKIAVDAMGGDYAPLMALQGVYQAAQLFPDIELILVGQQSLLEKMIVAQGIILPATVSLCDAPDVIAMDEAPVAALRKKKNSSIAVAADLVKQEKADALVTAGNTGAAVAATTLKWRLLPGIDRSGIALPFPNADGVSVLLDVGANVECKPLHFYHYAIMGKIYAEIILKKTNAGIGLLNVGEEAGKGGAEIKEVFHLFKEAYFNFIGNVEGCDVFNGRCDVIVCDGFVGNIVLKVAEGVVGATVSLTKKEIKRNIISMLGAFLCKPALQRIKKKVDYVEYGGAPLLGVNGVCIISHGSSTAKALFNAIRVAREFTTYDVNSVIVKEIEEHAKN